MVNASLCIRVMSVTGEHSYFSLGLCVEYNHHRNGTPGPILKVGHIKNLIAAATGRQAGRQ